MMIVILTFIFGMIIATYVIDVYCSYKQQQKFIEGLKDLRDCLTDCVDVLEKLINDINNMK